MIVSGDQKIRHVKKTNEQKEAINRLKLFLKENKIKKNGEISLAIYRLMCLYFTGGYLYFVGGKGLTLGVVYDKLAAAFDKYIERGFKLTNNDKNFLIMKKETILSFIKPFYWKVNNMVVGENFGMSVPDYIDGFGGGFNLDTNEFAV
ncbi:MAG: hypothetical protein LBH97_07345 [Treponema sp.]|jgi:hypothetical protein|nr:hypothetical protein [Treponema sp.]